MGETLAAAAAVVGLVVPTLHGIRLLTDDLNNVINAPRVIQRLTDELQSVHLSVACLKEIDEEQWKALGEKVAEQSKKALATCTKACDEVRGDLQRWTRRSKDGQRSWRERANIGFFKEKRITAIWEQLQSCKISLNTVASIASFHSSIRNFCSAEDLKAQLLARQTEINDIAVVAYGQAANVEQSLGVLRIVDKQEEAPESQADNSEDLEEDIEGAEMAMEDELLTLKALRDLLEELKASMAQAKVEEKAPPRTGSVQVNFGDNNHGAQIGTNHGPIGGIQIGQRG